MKRKILIEDTRSLRNGLLLLPVIDSLKKQYPKEELHVWVNAETADILKEDSRIDYCHIWQTKTVFSIKSMKQQIMKLKVHEFDYFISFSGRILPAMSTFFAKIPVRVGKKTGLFVNSWFSHTMMIKTPLAHESEENAELLYVLGIKKVLFTSSIICHQNDHFVVDHYLKDIKIKEKLVIVIYIKQQKHNVLNLQSLRCVIQKIRDAHNCHIILTGGGSTDLDKIRGVNIVNLINKLTMAQVQVLIKYASIILSTCDGVAQSAAFQDRPFVFISQDKSWEAYKKGFFYENFQIASLSNTYNIKDKKILNYYIANTIYLSVNDCLLNKKMSLKQTFVQMKQYLYLKTITIAVLESKKNKGTDVLSQVEDKLGTLSNISVLYTKSEIVKAIMISMLGWKKYVFIVNKSTLALTLIRGMFQMIAKNKVDFYDVPLNTLSAERHCDEIYRMSILIEK